MVSPPSPLILSFMSPLSFWRFILFISINQFLISLIFLLISCFLCHPWSKLQPIKQSSRLHEALVSASDFYIFKGLQNTTQENATGTITGSRRLTHQLPFMEDVRQSPLPAVPLCSNLLTLDSLLFFTWLLLQDRKCHVPFVTDPLF